MDHDLLLKRLYNNVMAQTISESGRFLFVGTQFADIFVQHIGELFKTEEPRPRLKCYPQEKNLAVNCLSFHRNFLIVGSVGIIYGLRWCEDKRELGNKPAWQTLLPIPVHALDVPDVNAMWLCPDVDQLFAGCGDNKIYQISLEDGRIIREYSGHTDYIHDLCVNDNGNIYSASEDGTVRVWSDLEKEPLATLEPHKKDDLARPEYGKFIGALSANNDWLVCGGGPKLSIWHLKSLECVRDFPFPGKVHACSIVDDGVFVGGEAQNVQMYDFSGVLKADIPVEHAAVYSIVWQTEPIKFMSVAGFSNKLHILEDFRFLDSKIDLYGNTED